MPNIHRKATFMFVRSSSFIYRRKNERTECCLNESRLTEDVSASFSNACTKSSAAASY